MKLKLKGAVGELNQKPLRFIVPLILTFLRPTMPCEMNITRPTSRVVMSGYVMMNIDCQNDTAAASTRNRSEYGASHIAWTERMVTDG